MKPNYLSAVSLIQPTPPPWSTHTAWSPHYNTLATYIYIKWKQKRECKPFAPPSGIHNLLLYCFHKNPHPFSPNKNSPRREFCACARMGSTCPSICYLRPRPLYCNMSKSVSNSLPLLEWKYHEPWIYRTEVRAVFKHIHLENGEIRRLK